MLQHCNDADNGHRTPRTGGHPLMRPLMKHSTMQIAISCRKKQQQQQQHDNEEEEEEQITATGSNKAVQGTTGPCRRIMRATSQTLVLRLRSVIKENALPAAPLSPSLSPSRSVCGRFIESRGHARHNVNSRTRNQSIAH